MNNVPVVVLADQNTVVKNRIRGILADQDIKIYEASNNSGVMDLITENNYHVNLIITDIEIDTNNEFDGMSLLKLVKSKSQNIPVVILTSISRKEVITRCILEGTSDYILKPFEDDFLREKLLKYLSADNLADYTVLKFNLSNFLNSELYKARKGQYAFSLLKVDFLLEPATGSAYQENHFHQYADVLFKTIRSLFWETDLYIQHGFQSHLGFFPFCDAENTRIVSGKIAAKYAEIQIEYEELRKYKIHQSFSTFPQDGATTSDLLQALTTRGYSANP